MSVRENYRLARESDNLNADTRRISERGNYRLARMSEREILNAGV